MPFTIRPCRRFPLQCSVTYNAGPIRGQGLNYVPRQSGNNQAYGLHVQFVGNVYEPVGQAWVVNTNPALLRSAGPDELKRNEGRLSPKALRLRSESPPGL